VEIGFKYGLIKGYPDGKMWPQGGVRVVEAVAMLARAYGEQTTVAPFRTSDDLQNTEGQWYTGAVSTILSRDGVMAGSRLIPAAYMTRGQLFDMVYRMRIASGQSTVTGAPVSSASSQNSNQVYTPATPVVNLPNINEGSPKRYASEKKFAISIPDLNILDLTVTHPADATTQKGVLAPLKEGVGHLFGYPGDGGKVMIYGHSSSYPWDLSQYTKIFRGINKVAIGQKIYVTYNDKLYVYQVSEKRTVPAKDNAAFEPDDNGEELILYTCWPPDSITHRFLVIATPVESIALK
jgi:LPXTG-site transpeptidase (sortase) family protein